MIDVTTKQTYWADGEKGNFKILLFSGDDTKNCWRLEHTGETKQDAIKEAIKMLHSYSESIQHALRELEIL